MGSIRLTSRAACLVIGGVLLALFAAAVPLSGLAHQNMNAGGGGVPVWVSAAFGAAGFVLAWRRPGNALGWIMLAGAFFGAVTEDASYYTVADYGLRHGDLPLGGHDPESPPLLVQPLQHLDDAAARLELVVERLVVRAVARDEVVDAGRVERAHLLVERRTADVGEQRLVGYLAREDGARSVPERREDHRAGVDQRAVEVEEDDREAHRGDASDGLRSAHALSGHAHVSCVSDSVHSPSARVLRYGTTWRRDGFVCRSSRAGLRCRNASGHGFFLSRQHSFAF